MGEIGHDRVVTLPGHDPLSVLSENLQHRFVACIIYGSGPGNGGQAPLPRNVTIEEVGNAAAFLCSDLASGITGDVLYIDTGYHILGA